MSERSQGRLTRSEVIADCAQSLRVVSAKLGYMAAALESIPWVRDEASLEADHFLTLIVDQLADVILRLREERGE